MKKIRDKKILAIFLSILIISLILLTSLSLFFPSSSHLVSPIVLSNIFSNKISVLNFGDVMFDRGVRNIIDNRGRDPFEFIKKDLSILEKYDFIIANLEGPIVEIDRELCQQKAYNFQFASDTPERLKSVGINIVNIANNHSHDCYKKGFESTKKYLDSSGIDHIGDVELDKSFIIKEVRGKRVAFVGIDALTSPIPVSKFYNLISKLKLENNYVVVNIHWGEEYNLGVTENQRAIAHKLIDSGATVVFGHHSHVVEPVEIYNNGVIFYSLGNFVFDQEFGDTKVGLGVGVEFGKGNMTVTLYPLNIKKFAPEFIKDEEREKFCGNILSKIEHMVCGFEVFIGG